MYARARARVTLWCVCARERVPRPAGWMGVEAVNAVRCLDREASQGSEESTAAPGALRPRVHCLHGSTAAPGSSTDPGASYGRRFGGELPADPPLIPGEIRDLVRYVNAQHKRPTCRSAAGQPAPRRQGSRLESPADAKTAFLSLSLSLSRSRSLSLLPSLLSLEGSPRAGASSSSRSGTAGRGSRPEGPLRLVQEAALHAGTHRAILTFVAGPGSTFRRRCRVPDAPCPHSSRHSSPLALVVAIDFPHSHSSRH